MKAVITKGLNEFNEAQGMIHSYLLKVESITERRYACLAYCLPTIVHQETGQILIPCGRYEERIKELGFEVVEVDPQNDNWFPEDDTI